MSAWSCMSHVIYECINTNESWGYCKHTCAAVQFCGVSRACATTCATRALRTPAQLHDPWAARAIGAASWYTICQKWALRSFYMTKLSSDLAYENFHGKSCTRYWRSELGYNFSKASSMVMWYSELSSELAFANSTRRAASTFGEQQAGVNTLKKGGS